MRRWLSALKGAWALSGEHVRLAHQLRLFEQLLAEPPFQAMIEEWENTLFRGDPRRFGRNFRAPDVKSEVHVPLQYSIWKHTLPRGVRAQREKKRG